MSDKWKKVSIYDVDLTIVDNDGEEQHFTFKPLPWSHFAAAYDVILGIQRIQPTGADKMSEDEANNYLMANLSKELIQKMSEVLLAMVMNSYPDLDAKTAEGFVMANLFNLVGVLGDVVSRQSTNTRKAAKALQ